VVGNNTDGAIEQLLAVEKPGPVARIALVYSDTFDNFPPGLTVKALVTAGKLPRHCSARPCSSCGSGPPGSTVRVRLVEIPSKLYPRPAGPADGVRPRAQRVPERAVPSTAADGAR
jgi:hypothetical protein